MKIADFFVNIAVNGDIKEIRELLELKKKLTQQTKESVDKAKEEKKEKKEQIKNEEKSVKNDSQIFNLLLKGAGLQKDFGKLLLKNTKLGQGLVGGVGNLTKGLGGAVGATLAIATAFVAVGNKIRDVINEATQLNQVYTNFQRQTGISMQSPISLSGAMASLDVTMTPEDIMKNMEQLQSNLVGLQFGMGNVAPYQIMGLQPYGQDASTMIDALRTRLKMFAPEMRTFLLQQMGLDPRLGALADLSASDFEALKKGSIELYLNANDRKQLQGLASEWNKTGLAWQKLWDKIVLILGRQFAGLGDFLGDLARILERVFEILEAVIAPLLDALKAILLPIWLVIDDLLAYMLGQDSMFGRMLKGEVKFGDVMKTIWDYTKDKFASPKIYNKENFADNGLGRGMIQTLLPGLGSTVVMGADWYSRPSGITNNFDVKVSANTISDAEGIYNATKPIFTQATTQIANGVNY